MNTLIILILSSTGANIERIQVDECPPDAIIQEFEQYYSTSDYQVYATCGVVAPVKAIMI
tara:strand:- start:3175 stop:3354 length:180 start_codon:yes stop_codon:yes gene_type:complete